MNVLESPLEPINPDELVSTQPFEDATSLEQSAYNMSYLAARKIVENSALVEENRTLREENELEPKTGLLNSEAFMRRVTDVAGFERRRSEVGRSHVLAFLDLDDFKDINSALTETVVDERVLLPVAEILSSGVRSGDLVARVGGEEFAIFLADTDLTDALSIIDNIRQAINDLPVKGWSKLIGISVGLAEYKQGNTYIDIKKRANAAENNAKKKFKDEGKNRTLVWDPSMDVDTA